MSIYIVSDLHMSHEKKTKTITITRQEGIVNGKFIFKPTRYVVSEDDKISS